MPRRPAQITQADVARIIRAAKQAGAAEVVVKVGEQSVIVKLGQSTGQVKDLAADEEISSDAFDASPSPPIPEPRSDAPWAPSLVRPP
jgi:hypothetical protein